MLEQSISTPEICGSNPNIGKFYLPIVQLNRKDENEEKEAGNGPFFKKIGTPNHEDLFRLSGSRDKSLGVAGPWTSQS